MSELQCVFSERPDGPEGCPMLPMPWPLLEMVVRLHFQARPGLLELIRRYREGRTGYHLRSPMALR